MSLYLEPGCNWIILHFVNSRFAPPNSTSANPTPQKKASRTEFEEALQLLSTASISEPPQTKKGQKRQKEWDFYDLGGTTPVPEPELHQPISKTAFLEQSQQKSKSALFRYKRLQKQQDQQTQTSPQLPQPPTEVYPNPSPPHTKYIKGFPGQQQQQFRPVTPPPPYSPFPYQQQEPIGLIEPYSLGHPNPNMLFSFAFRFLSRPLCYCWHSVRSRLCLATILTLFLRLLSIFVLALLTPVLLRRLFASNFVELQQPLEFIFRTCSDELAGVCSFPEAQFSLEEEDIQLQPGYYYSFVLDIVLFDTPQNRQLSIVLASVMLKDARMKLLSQHHKSVPIFNAFNARSVTARLYTLTRNLVFWPLYLGGFFSTGGYELSEQYSIHFPNYYMERDGRPTRYMVVQLQNKFIQLSSATLRVRTHLNIFSAFVSEYPLVSYALMFAASFSLFSSAFVLFHCVHWARRFIRSPSEEAFNNGEY